MTGVDYSSSGMLMTILPTEFCFCRASKAAIVSAKGYAAAMTGLMLCAAAKAANSETEAREKPVWPRTIENHVRHE
jgi:hypothetical protein